MSGKLNDSVSVFSTIGCGALGQYSANSVKNGLQQSLKESVLLTKTV